MNAAGAAIPSTAVVQRMVSHLIAEQERGGYAAADAARAELEAVYAKAAALVGAAAPSGAERPADTIALTESATVAWLIALSAVETTLGVGPGDVLLCGESEYAANAVALMHCARRTGATVEVVPSVAEEASAEAIGRDIGRESISSSSSSSTSTRT